MDGADGIGAEGDGGLTDVEALPRVALDIPASQVRAALAHLADAATCSVGEVFGAEVVAGRVVVTLGHRHNRRTALLRRLNALSRVGVEVHDFAWVDAVVDPSDSWMEDSFTNWGMHRHRDPNRIEPIEVARRRFGRLHGQELLERLIERVTSSDLDQRRRSTIAHAAVLTGFNTHTTAAGNALVVGAVAVQHRDGFTAGRLLNGALGIAELGRFGMHTDIAEAPLVPLVQHEDWNVHVPATRLLAALTPPRSDEATDVLVRLGHELARGARSTDVRAEKIVAALAATASHRTDVDGALDALRHHVTSAVRVDATVTLADRRPERARSLWEPWLGSRSTIERTAAESMIATRGDARDVPEVARIVAHRTKPSKGIAYWPPLSAEGLAFLVRHADVPEATEALMRVRSRWARHDDDLRRWLRAHHPDLVPACAEGP